MQQPPLTPGGPPIWCGARQEAALRRIGRKADGWMSYVVTPRRFQRVVAARELSGLRVPPSHRLEEALRGDREGRYSIRINDQWRVRFRCTEQGAVEIEITDYH